MNTIYIAQILGIFFVVVGGSMMANRKGTAAAIEATVLNRGILLLWGFLAVLIGATVVINNTWMPGLAILVAILGWLAIVKGVFILIFPNLAVSLYKKCSTNGVLIFCGVIAFVLGIVLLYW